MITISVGIMAYNEEANIRGLLNAVIDQKIQEGTVSEIFIVSSGSRDKTNDIVREFE